MSQTGTWGLDQNVGGSVLKTDSYDIAVDPMLRLLEGLNPGGHPGTRGQINPRGCGAVPARCPLCLGYTSNSPPGKQEPGLCNGRMGFGAQAVKRSTLS